MHVTWAPEEPWKKAVTWTYPSMDSGQGMPQEDLDRIVKEENEAFKAYRGCVADRLAAKPRESRLEIQRLLAKGGRMGWRELQDRHVEESEKMQPHYVFYKRANTRSRESEANGAGMTLVELLGDMAFGN